MPIVYRIEFTVHHWQMQERLQELQENFSHAVDVDVGL